jgi:hypothetical protein
VAPDAIQLVPWTFEWAVVRQLSGSAEDGEGSQRHAEGARGLSAHRYSDTIGFNPSANRAKTSDGSAPSTESVVPSGRRVLSIVTA